MKYIITSLTLFIGFSVFAQQKINQSAVPAEVLKSYDTQNSLHSGKDVWHVYPDKYTVEWKENKEHTYTFSYKKDGTWISRVRKAAASELSAETTQDIAKRYQGYKITGIISEIRNDGKFFIIDLKKAKSEDIKCYYLMSGAFDHEVKK